MKPILKLVIKCMVALCLIITGVLLGGLEDITSDNYRINNHNKENINYKSTQTVQKIKLDIYCADVEFIEREAQNIEIHAQNINNHFHISQENSELVIQQSPKLFVHRQAYVQIYVPKDFIYKNIDFTVRAGKVTANTLRAEKINIHSSACYLKIKQIQASLFQLTNRLGNTFINQLESQQIDITSTMGNVETQLQNEIQKYNYEIDVGIGHIDIGSQKYTGIVKEESIYGLKDKKIKIECHLGNVCIKDKEEN